MRFWRISNFTDLSGRGALTVDGRWHSAGVPIVYLADHPSTSLLEILMHANRFTVPESFQLLEVEGPDGVSVGEPTLTANWNKNKDDKTETQAAGDQFLREAEFAVLRVPSVVMPRAVNYLLNPAHEEAAGVRIISIERYPFDSRLFG